MLVQFNKKGGITVRATGVLAVSHTPMGITINEEQIPETQEQARTETRGRKKKEPAADVQPGTMFTPPAE